MRVVAVAILVALVCTGCSTPAAMPEARRLRAGERDSVLATSPLPGASMVGRAQAVSNVSDRRNQGQAETLREIGDTGGSGDQP
jgi:hypothetical protein